VRRRVLVARLDSMGDVLLAGPAVRAVAASAEVVMLCGPRGADAGRLLPGVAEVIEWDAPWIADPAPPATAATASTLIRRVERANIAEAVILTSFHQSPLPLALCLRFAGVARIGGASVDYAGSLLDVRLRPGEDLPEDIPEPERALRIANAAGFTLPDGDDGRLAVRETRDMTAVTGTGAYVVLHPGAAVGARRWPVERFAETARLLAERGVRVVVTGTPGESALTAAVVDGVPGAIDLAIDLDLASLAGLLARAAVVVVGNTGPGHLAAAVGTPVVSLFSPVVPAVRWAPYRVPVALLGDQSAPCRLSRARECPVAGHPCLSTVTAEDAVDAIARLAPDLLAGRGAAARASEEVLT